MTIDTESLHRLAFDAAPVLLDAAVKGAVLLAAAAVLTTAMRKASAAARQCVWLLALVSVLALPVASALLPGWQVLPGWAKLDVPADAGGEGADEVTWEPQPPTHARPVEVVAAEREAGPAPVEPVVARAVETPQRRPTGLVPVALAVWLAGTLACLLPLLLGRLQLWWAGRRWRRIDGGPWGTLARRAAETVGLRRTVALLQSDGEPMPMVWGTVRPRLLLPASADQWSADRRWVVLLHELVHVRRHDCLAQLLARLACAVYWFNPLCWVAFKRMQREAEAACDDLVLAAGHRPSDYAQHLLEMASGLDGAALAACGPIAMARPGKLQGRLRAILDDRRDRRALTRVGALVALALAVAAVVPMSVLTAAGRPAFDKAHVSILVGPSDRPVEAGKAKVLTLDRREDIDALAAFFPGVGQGRASSRAGAWEADVVVKFAAPAGKTVRVTVSLAESPPTWSEGRGDWPVKGDLGAFLRKLAKDEVATQPAMAATATAPAKAGGERETTTRVYDVRDLLVVVPKVVGGEQGGIAEWPAGAAEPADKEPTRAELLKNLLELLRSTVDPDSWRQGWAAVREINRQLLITQSPANHEQIARLLAQLRQGRGVLVRIEARLMTPGPGVDRVLHKMFPDARPGFARSGESKVPGCIMTAEQVEKLIAASQTVPGEVRLLTLPRVTVFSGRRARLENSRKQTLSLPVEGREGERADIPYYSGIQVEVGATASADRRRATLTVKAQVAELTRVDGRLEESGAALGANNVTVPEGSTLVLRLPQTRSRLTSLREVIDPKTGKRSFKVIRQPIIIGSLPAPVRFLYVLVTLKDIVQQETHEVGEPPGP